MFGLLIFLVVITAILVVPVAAFYAVRGAMRALEPLRGQAADQAALEARLSRIEDAVDTVAAEVERLAEQQRIHFGGRSGTALPAPRNAAGEGSGD
jgi:hypothetical protein